MEDKKSSRIRLNRSQKTLLLARSNFKCACCGVKLDESTMTIDHIYPLNLGGDNSTWNMMPLCKTCNNAKSNFIYSLRGHCAFLADGILEIYENELNKKIYSAYSDKSIFGKSIREGYMVTRDIDRCIGVSKINRNSAIKAFGRRIEVRPLMRGDINEDVVNFIEDSVSYKSKLGYIKGKVNEYLLRDMFSYCSFYGAYEKDEIRGLRIYCNIENLEVENKEELMTTLKYLGFDGAYVTLLYIEHKRVRGLEDLFKEFEGHFMASTNNIVLKSIECATDLLRDDNEKYTYELPSKGELFPGGLDMWHIILDNSFYEKYLDKIKEYKKLHNDYDVYKEVADEVLRGLYEIAKNESKYETKEKMILEELDYINSQLQYINTVKDNKEIDVTAVKWQRLKAHLEVIKKRLGTELKLIKRGKVV